MRKLTMAFVILGWAAAASAQSGEASIRGYIRDEQGAVLPGVTVTASSPTVARIHTSLSDASGSYRLIDLPPGEYTLSAELQGFSKYVRQGVVLRAGLNLNVDVALTVGVVSETVEVRGEAPLLEARSSVQAVNVSGDFQRAVPLSGRRYWHDFMNLIPGMVSTELGNQPFILHGSSFDVHVMQLDGADLAPPSQNTNVYINLSNEALEDVQVKIGAVDASAPLGTGAVINMVTKSGTNELRGAAAFAYQNKAWNDNNNPGGTTSQVEAWQPDVSAGGPLIRDRWWLFGAYRYRHDIAGISRSAEQIAILEGLEPGFEPFGNKSAGHFPFVKTTVQFSPNHQAYVFYQRDLYPRNLSQTNHGSILSFNDVGGDAYSARVSSVWGQALTTRVGFSYNNKVSENRNNGNGPARTVHQNAFLSSGRLVGTGAIALLDNSTADFGSDNDKITLSADAAYFKSGWGGSHELQAGMYLQPRNRSVSTTRYTNGGFAQQEEILRDPGNASGGTIPFYRRVYDVEFFQSRAFTNADYGLYVQDAWKPSGRLTLNLGLRIDIIRRDDDLFGVKLQGSTEVGPRLGVNYLLTQDQRNAIRASWVRVHELMSTQRFAAGSSTSGFSDLYDNDLDGVFETVFRTPGSTALSASQVIDQGFHQPYIDEWTVGYRRQLPGRTTLDVSFLHRDFRDRTAGIDINAIYEDGVFKGYKDVTQNTILLVTNNTYNWPVYTGLELLATKQTARLQLLGSYTRQWRHIDGTWLPNDPASIVQPEVFPNDDGIGDTNGSTGDFNSLTGTNMVCCNLVLWRDHAFRAAAVYQAPWDLTVATSYTYQSNLWAGPTVDRIAAPDPRFGPTTVTLSNGRVVPNPLATTIRFVGPTRGDNQVRLPSTHVWNLRIGRAFHFGDRRLEPSVDIFNIPNNGADQFTNFGQTNQRYSPNYGKGLQKQLPRSAQVSVRFIF